MRRLFAIIIFLLIAAQAGASKLVSCPGVAAGSTCVVSLVSLSGATPTTVLTNQAMTEISDPGGHGKSEYVYSYAGDLNSLLEYRAWCYCTQGSDVYYWMYVWEPYETRIDAATSSRLATSGYIAPDNGNIGQIAMDTAVIRWETETVGVQVADAAKSGYSLSSAGNGAIWDVARLGHSTAGTFGEGVTSVQGNVTGTVSSVTGAVGLVTGSVGSVAAPVTVGTNNDKTAYSLTADYNPAKTAASQSSVSAIPTNPLLTTDVRLNNLDATISSRSTYAGGAVASVTGSVGSVTAPVTVGTNNDKTGYTASTVTDKTGYSLSSTGAGAIWDVARLGHSTAGTFGEGVASIQGNVTGSVGSVTGAVGSVAGSVTGSVGSVTAPVTVGTNNDKTGYALTADYNPAKAAASQASVSAIPTNPLLTTDVRLNNLDATISSRSTYAGGAVASVTGSVGSVTAPVTVGTNNDKTGYTASTVTDKTGYALSSTGAGAIWDVARLGHSTAGTFGEGAASVQGSVTGNVSGSVASVTSPVTLATSQPNYAPAKAGDAMALTPAYDAAKAAASQASVSAIPTNPLLTTDMRLNNLDATISSRSTYAGGAVASVTGSVGSVATPVTVGTNNDKTGYTVSVVQDKTGYSFSSAGAGTIWDVNRAAHTIPGTFGEGVASVQGNVTGSVGSVTGNVLGSIGSLSGPVVLSGAQPNYAPAKAGDPMTLTSAYDAAKTAASQASVSAIPTNPLLTTDARLNNLDATISSRSTYAGGPVASVTGSVGSVSSPVTVGTNNDKTGYALTSAYDAAKTAAAPGAAMTLTSAYDAAKTAAAESTILRGLGLMMENHVEDDIVYDIHRLKTGSTIYLYDSKAHAQTHDKVTGLIAKYSVTFARDVNGMITLFKVLREQ